MSYRDVHVLNRFTQKMAAGETGLPDFSSYMTPEVIGAAGGAAVGGLGAMGLQKLLRSKEDEERGDGSYMPAVLGALAGGAGGYLGGPALAQHFKPAPKQPPRAIEELGDLGSLDAAKSAPGQV